MSEREYNKGKLLGIGLFQLEIIHLISIGIKEKIQTIEKCFEEENLVEYLYEKYNEEFSIEFDGGIYDNDAINRYFFEYCGYIEGNESNKYGIENEEDGLLLIIALISDRIEKESYKWENE